MSQATAILQRLEKKLRFTDKGNTTNLAIDISEGMSGEDHDNRLDWVECNLWYSIHIYTQDKRCIVINLHNNKITLSAGNRGDVFITDVRVIKEDAGLVLIAIYNNIDAGRFLLY